MFGTFFLAQAQNQDSRSDVPDTIKRQNSVSGVQGATGISYEQNKDIGELRYVQRSAPPPTLSLYTLQGAFYTDNAFLTPQAGQGSFGWSGLFGAAVVPYSTIRWIPSISAERYMFRHTDAAAADYDTDALTFANDLALNGARTVWWRASYSVWRFEAAHGGSSSFLKYGQLDNRLSWGQPIRTSLYLYEAGGLEWRHATPGFYDRLTPYLELGLRHQALNTVQISPYVRSEGRFYIHDVGLIQGRKDFHLETGLLVQWSPTDYLRLTGSYFWRGNFSNFSALDYQENRPFAGVSAVLSF
ncbi:MAG: hypothetical protein JWM16_1306 [Verrucomicrobiales bacterium]|nr:hypothetical protein [Verrucomicrobiales bacterium]